MNIHKIHAWSLRKISILNTNNNKNLAESFVQQNMCYFKIKPTTYNKINICTNSVYLTSISETVSDKDMTCIINPWPETFKTDNYIESLLIESHWQRTPRSAQLFIIILF